MNLRDLFNTSGGGNLNSTLSTLKNIFSETTQNQSSINQTNSAQAVEELALLFETMYNILTQKGVFTNEEFQKKFDEIDMSDGVKDGKHKK
ncbi:MAG: hypothetical protein A2086_15555 [Spirochaetes bacterium GWD1_27_9]|nr:MAG: hypothetical protein A2Y34_07310 [Spirochaetes bacterium GWC1_27_15]OHD42798.1 MAG: hypothetical protein A2086_15555 [Spirochaetes bacterium GWD1_27_9]